MQRNDLDNFWVLYLFTCDHEDKRTHTPQPVLAMPSLTAIENFIADIPLMVHTDYLSLSDGYAIYEPNGMMFRESLWY